MLPKHLHKYIGELKGVDGVSYVIYFVRKDDGKDGCGFYSANSRMDLIRKCNLKALDKFKKKPKTWSDIEPIYLDGADYIR